jgi:hypothetical protein
VACRRIFTKQCISEPWYFSNISFMFIGKRGVALAHAQLYHSFVGPAPHMHPQAQQTSSALLSMQSWA